MRDLKCKPRYRDTGVFGACTDPVDAFCVGRTVPIEPEARFSQIGLGIGEAQRPESNVMAPARAVIDRLLKTKVLTTPKKIEGTERGCRIGRVQYECPDHVPGACEAEPIGLRPASNFKGSVKLLQRPRQHEINRIAG